jgi:predicted CXXCH cytochrome family protein
MRQKTVLAFIVVILVFLVMVVVSVEKPPHAFTECSSCHVLPDPAGSGAMARKMTGPVTQLCRRCHEKILSEGYMHPVDTRPERVIIPADMPLSPRGEIMCATCHDVHSDYATPYGAPSHFLRRREAGKAFCRICHGNLDTLSQGHAASLGEAHFRSQYIVTDSSQELDPMSQNCISCHDGTYASSISIRAGTWKHGKDFLRHDQGSHPIGVEKTDLKPLSLVDRRIRFFNGKVGCGSCHDPYSALDKKLVMSDRNSELCFSCHIV